MAKVDREKLRTLVQESGKSARHHSLQAGLGDTAIRDILSGKSANPSTDTIERVAGQLGVPADEIYLSGHAHDEDPRVGGRIAALGRQIVPRFLSVRYKVAAGTWSEVGVDVAPDPEIYPVVPDPRYSAWSQWLELVEGDSANKKIPHGHFAHVVDAVQMGYTPKNKNWVVLERRRLDGRLRERTIKQVEVGPDGKVLFWPRSTNPAYSKPIDPYNDIDHGETIEVEIVGLVIGAYDPEF